MLVLGHHLLLLILHAIWHLKLAWVGFLEAIVLLMKVMLPFTSLLSKTGEDLGVSWEGHLLLILIIVTPSIDILIGLFFNNH